MLEIVTEALVLDKEDLGEADSRVFLYTKDFGKVVAKATSARKITSKLAPHLEPLNYVTVRLVSRGDSLENTAFQLADALIIKRKECCDIKTAAQIFDLVKQGVPEGVPDLEIWNFLKRACAEEKDFTLGEALQILGFDSSFAVCEVCKQVKPEYFFPKDHFFICRNCALSFKVSKKELIRI